MYRQGDITKYHSGLPFLTTNPIPEKFIYNRDFFPDSDFRLIRQLPKATF